jgi:phosphoribosylformylglycinamidine synthase
MRASYAVFAELRARGLEVGFKDLGAGGLAGCSAELCAAGGMGAEVDLDSVVTGQQDLPPEVIAIGETQERLCWIVPPSFTPTLLSLYNDVYTLPRVARGACAAVIGKVTDSGRYVARHRGETVMDVDLAFLTGGVRYARPYVLPVVKPEPAAARERAIEAAVRKRPGTLFERLRAVLAHRDVCSRASIYQRYDGVVRGCTAIPPGYADAGVLVPVPGAPLATALGLGGNPRYGKIDPRRAAELAVIEAIANVTAVGATPAGLTDCLNFGDPTVPEHMGAFVAAVDGLAEAAGALGVPFVSGNVSLYNRSSSGNHVAPSPIVACVGTLANVANAVTMALKRAGSPIAFVAPPAEAIALGGSVIAEQLGLESSALPAVDYAWFGRACAFVREAIARGLVLAARDVSDGGFLVALAEMALAARANGTPLGLAIEEDDAIGATSPEMVWNFSEEPGFVLEVGGEIDALDALAQEHGVELGYGSIVTTAEPRLALHSERSGKVTATVSLDELAEAWEAPLRDFYGSATAS